jgi:membrane protease YdiL (CAAX protease family)
MPGEITMLIPEDPVGRVIWVAVSFTAGFCEETAFRGYIMTRLRLIFKLDNWVIPTIVSSVAFGACHAYQGLPGIIIIGTYGLMFSLLYLRTRTLWPCIIAHSLQDLGALFFPQ